MTRKQFKNRALKHKFAVASHIRDDYYIPLYFGEDINGVRNAISRTAKPLVLKNNKEINVL